jgi:hypothetical protein
MSRLPAGGRPAILQRWLTQGVAHEESIAIRRARACWRHTLPATSALAKGGWVAALDTDDDGTVDLGKSTTRD